MPRFQGLHVVPKVEPPESPSTGLEPYLALQPRPRSKSNASALRDPWHWFWLGLIGVGYAATVVLTALLISWVWP